MQIHNAAVTGSFIYNGVDISSITGSTSNIDTLNAITASILSTTASLNLYTGSNDTNISNIHLTTASLNTFTGSAQSQLSALQVTSGSNITRISALEVASGSAITRLSALEVTSGSNISRLSSLESKTGSYATTGSNTFVGSQVITGSVLQSGSLSVNGCITATGQIVAQTINVQQVTSSIVYSCGSNTFGTILSNSQIFTGSLQVTGSSHYIIGNTGISVTSPCAQFHVNSIGNYIWSAGNGYGDFYIGNGTYGLSVGGAIGGGGAGDTRMWTKGGTHTFYIGTSNTDAVKVDANQNVCIAGQICGAKSIHAESNYRVSSGTSAGNATDPAITTGGCTKAGIYFAGSCVALGSGGNMLLLNQCGRVGIGTATPDYGNLSIFCVDNTVLSSAVWGTSTAAGVTATVYNGSQCANSVAGLRLITRNSGASIWNIYNVSTGASTGDLAFGNGESGIGYEKVRITNAGITCFACTVCVGGEMIVKGNAGACNTHYFTTGAANVAKYIQYNATGTAINQIAADAHSYFNSGCRFGIGSNSPTFKLDVQDATQAVIRVLDTTSNNSLILQAGTGAGMKVTGYNYNTSTAVPLYISVDGADTIMQRSGGNVGIGTCSPSAKLQVQGTSSGITDDGIFFISTNTASRLTFGLCEGNYAYIRSAQPGVAYRNLILQPDGGYVGIGTTTPTYRLTTVGSEGTIHHRVDSDGIGANVHVRPNAGRCGWVSYTEDGVADRWGIGIKNGDGNLYFSSGNVASGGGTTRITIDSTGVAYFACKPSFPGASLICTYTCTYSSYTAGCWLGLFAGDNGFNGAYAFTVVGQFNLGGSGLYSMNYSTVPYIHKSDSIGSTNGNDFHWLPSTNSGHADNGALICFRRARYTGNSPVGNRTEFCMNVNYSNSFTATTYVLAWL